MKQLFSKFLVAFLLTSAVVLSWSEYFLKDKHGCTLYLDCQYIRRATQPVIIIIILLGCKLQLWIDKKPCKYVTSQHFLGNMRSM